MTVTRDEWDKLSNEARPSIRFCVPVFVNPYQNLIIPAAEIRDCAWCTEQVWVDMAQELPAEARERVILIVCVPCVLAHPVLGPSATENMPEIFRHWTETGVVKAIKIEE